MGARFSASVQTGPGTHPATCTMVTGSFPMVKSGRGLRLTSHPLLVPWSIKSRAISLLFLWAVRPVHSLSACTRVHFTFTLPYSVVDIRKILEHNSAFRCKVLGCPKGLQRRVPMDSPFPQQGPVFSEDNKEFLCITHTVEHNYISPGSTVGIQLHVSALYVGHLQVVI